MTDNKPGAFRRKAWHYVAIILAALGSGLASAQQCASDKACDSGVVTDTGDCILLK